MPELRGVPCKLAMHETMLRDIAAVRRGEALPPMSRESYRGKVVKPNLWQAFQAALAEARAERGS